MKLNINGIDQVVPEEWQEESLLFVLREYFGLIGARFGCGQGLCGACTVIVDGEAVRSCVTPLNMLAKSMILTVEGLAKNGELHPVQQAWKDKRVAQCGYCQAGQIMSAVVLLEKNPNPDRSAIEEAMEGNLCRCGSYQRIREAVAQASGAKQ